MDLNPLMINTRKQKLFGTKKYKKLQSVKKHFDKQAVKPQQGNTTAGF